MLPLVEDDNEVFRSRVISVRQKLLYDSEPKRVFADDVPDTGGETLLLPAVCAETHASNPRMVVPCALQCSALTFAPPPREGVATAPRVYRYIFAPERRTERAEERRRGGDAEKSAHQDFADTSRAQCGPRGQDPKAITAASCDSNGPLKQPGPQQQPRWVSARWHACPACHFRPRPPANLHSTLTVPIMCVESVACER